MFKLIGASLAILATSTSALRLKTFAKTNVLATEDVSQGETDAMMDLFGAGLSDMFNNEDDGSHDVTGQSLEDSDNETATATGDGSEGEGDGSFEPAEMGGFWE